MTEYNLGTMDTIAGSFVFKLQHTDATLTIPSSLPIISVGQIKEKIDFSFGIHEIENLTLTVREDYEDYTEGFWNFVLNDTIYDEDVELKVELDGDIIFWGVIYREGTKFTEHYLSDTEHVRDGSLLWVSLLYKLKQIPVTDLTTEVLTHDAVGTYNSNPYTFIKAKGIVASMIALAYSQTYALTDVVIRNDTDLLYTENSNNHGFEDVFIITGNIGYFNAADFNAFESHYETCFDLLQALTRNFGFVARWFYDSGHKIELLTRGRSYATTLGFNDRESESSLTASYPIKPGNIRGIFQLLNSTGQGYTAQHWYVNGELGGDLRLYNDADPEKGNPPKFADIDMDVNMPFILSWDNENAIGEDLFINTSGSTYVRVTSTRYYDYRAAGYVDETYGTKALATYYFKRFSPNRRIFNRIYSGLSAEESSVDSIDNLKLLKRTSIDDGIGAQTFYISELTLDFEEFQTEVEWTQE